MLLVLSLTIGAALNSTKLSTSEIKVTRSLGGFGDELTFEGVNGQLLGIGSSNSIEMGQTTFRIVKRDYASDYITIFIDRDSAKELPDEEVNIDSALVKITNNEHREAFFIKANAIVNLENFSGLRANIGGKAAKVSIKIL
jgi:hypothetical protein